MNDYLLNYQEIINNALLPMIIALFALSFPLLFQTISRIDDKYNSTKLIEVFKKEKTSKYFIISLFGAVLSYILWLFQLSPLFGISHLLIDYSAFLLLIIFTVSLVFTTFLISYRIYIYYVPDKLLAHLIKKHNASNIDRNKKLYFEAISKILNYSINKADEYLARELLDFYSNAFVVFRKGKEGLLIDYPQEYYDTIFEANELLCNRKGKTISYFNDSTLFGLFLDEYQDTVISNKTYDFIWKLLIQSLLYDRDEFIISYWKKSHQLCSICMKIPNKVYNETFTKIQNQLEIDKKESERDNFLEFHYALGGVLMYQRKYNIIREIIYYTNSHPPRYVLVPERMVQIIERYMSLNWKSYQNPFYYELKYYFPNINSVNADSTIIVWIKKYLSILFIRQYVVNSYNISYNSLKTPELPEDLSELNHWKRELDGLEYYINKYLSEYSVLEEIGLEQFYGSNWFSEHSLPQPSELIKNFKEEIKNKFIKIKSNQEVSNDKEKEFNNNTLNILVPLFDKYSKIFSNPNIGTGCCSYRIIGQHYILEKASFSENQDLAYLNNDTITAEAVKVQFMRDVLNPFLMIKPKKYFLQEQDLFKALERLNINVKDYYLIAIDLNLDYFKNYLKIKKLKNEEDEWCFHNSKIIEINSYYNESIANSLIIIRKLDIPNILFEEVDKPYIYKYNLKKIDNTYNIFTSVNDLNKINNSQLKKEIEEDTKLKDLSQKVQVCVDINVEIKFKNMNYYQLKVFSQFEDRGAVSSVDDIDFNFEYSE